MSVFLTGATGVVGSRLLPLLLSEPDVRVVALIRARDPRDLHERTSSLLRFCEIPEGDPRTARLIPVAGDVSSPLLGLSSADHERLERTTTRIIHCAASVKLDLPLEEARRAAVTSLRSILALAERSPGLTKLDLVSTVGVFGRTPGLMPERPLPLVREFHNTYEAAKAEAERLAFERWRDLPITVHRPSMVVGDSRTGRAIRPQVFHHLCDFLTGRRTLGVVPRTGGFGLDLIPVDHVARAIHWASRHGVTAGRVLHLCSGPRWSVPLDLLQERVRASCRAAGHAVPRLVRIPHRVLRRSLLALGRFLPAKLRRASRALGAILGYLDEPQAFDNSETVEYLDAAGLVLPEPADYLDRVLPCQEAPDPTTSGSMRGALRACALCPGSGRRASGSGPRASSA